MKPTKNNKRKDLKPKDDIDSKLLEIRRVTRVMAGGKRMSFRAVVAAGNKKGLVGIGVSKGLDVSAAVEKSTRKAKSHLVAINLNQHTVPHDAMAKFCSVKVLIKPAEKGSGLIAGSAARTICDLAGVQNASIKILSRSSNPLNIAKATMAALAKMKNPNLKKSKAKKISETEKEPDEQKPVLDDNSKEILEKEE